MSAQTQQSLSISPSAQKRLAFLLGKEESPNAKFRVAVDGGGCSGFQYRFSFDATQNDDDVVIEAGDAKVVIDEMSLELVNGAELDFIDELGGAFFAVKNPNATASCGCGNSFSV